MMHTARWSFALLFAAVHAAMTALVAAAAWMAVGFVLEGDPDVDGLAGPLSVLVMIMFGAAVIKYKSPKLQIQTDRLVVWRGGVRITMLVAEFDAVGEQSGITPETLRFRAGTIESQQGRSSNRFLEKNLRKHKMDRTIMPSQFFADWRLSELGSLLPGVRSR